MVAKEIKTVRLSVFLPALIFLSLSFSITGQAQEGNPDKRGPDTRESTIRLPETDGHYKVTRSYIEDIPDADYLHAPAASHEAFRDMKFGVRIHWGLYSVKEMNKESWKFLDFSNADKQAYLDSYKGFNPVDFSADKWMSFFKRAGAQCFSFTTKHHDGFSLFDTKTRIHKRVNYLSSGGPAIEDCSLAYSVMESPFKRDIVKELCESARNHGLKINLYFSHPDWFDADFRPFAFHPLQTEDIKNNPLDYGNPNIFKNNVNKIMTAEPTSAERARMILRHQSQLKELLTNYGKIDMLCLDQYLGKSVWPELKKTIKELRMIQPDVMFRARGIGNYGDYYTPEGFVPGNKENTEMPWMVIYPLASTFSYDKDSSNYKGAQWIISNLVDAVAKGGNFMVGIGPDGRGNFHPSAITQLEQAGEWLAINGEGIYDTRPAATWKEGKNIRFTRTKDEKYLYAFSLAWPVEKLVLETVRPRKGSKIYMMGVKKPLKWIYKNKQLTIMVPQRLQLEPNHITKFACGFKIQGIQTEIIPLVQ
jgi:alpha-L-fucosidase